MAQSRIQTHVGTYNGYRYSPTYSYNRIGLGDPVDIRIMLLLKKEINKDWKDLGRALGLEEEELQKMESGDQKDEPEELAYLVLLTWTRRDRKSVIKELVECLQYISRMDLVTKILQQVSFPDKSLDEDGSKSTRKGHQEILPQRPRGILGWMSQQHQIDRNFGVLRKSLMRLYPTLKTTALPWMNRRIGDSYEELSLENTAVTDIFRETDKSGKAARILIEGHAGYGKTTLASKICYDWALKKEEYVCNFDVVLLLPLRQFTGLQDLLCKATGNILNDINTLWAVLKDQSKNILFIFDGFDEMNDDCDREVLNILQGDALQHVTMVVTARPGRYQLGVKANGTELSESTENGVPDGNGLWRRRIRIEGISQRNRAEFLKKCSKRFVPNLKTVEGNEENGSSLRPMFDCPLHLLLLAALPKNEKEKCIFQTKTELYKAVFNYVAQRYWKQTTDQPTDLFDIQNAPNTQLADDVNKLGNIALDALRIQTLSFEWVSVKTQLDFNPRLYELGLFPKNGSLNDFLHEPIHASMLEFAVAYHLWKMYHEGNKTDWKKHLETFKPKQSRYASCIIPFLKDLMIGQSSELLQALGLSEVEYKELFSVPGFEQ